MAPQPCRRAAADVSDFYRGKRINFVIGYGTGGGYDIYARLFGRFIGEHIPGNPTLWSELGEGEGQRQILEILSGGVAVGRPIPPS